jgi:hypothetical protein
MLKAALLTILLVVVSILGWFTYILGLAQGCWNPLIRPRGVAGNARYVYIFGKSAEWFSCQVNQRRDVDVCSAWDDYGRLVAAGDFRLRDENRAATTAELQPSMVGPGGASGHSDVIYLFGPDRLILGKELVRVGSKSERERFGVEIPGGSQRAPPK